MPFTRTAGRGCAHCTGPQHKDSRQRLITPFVAESQTSPLSGPHPPRRVLHFRSSRGRTIFGVGCWCGIFCSLTLAEQQLSCGPVACEGFDARCYVTTTLASRTFCRALCKGDRAFASSVSVRREQQCLGRGTSMPRSALCIENSHCFMRACVGWRWGPFFTFTGGGQHVSHNICVLSTSPREGPRESTRTVSLGPGLALQ